MKKDLDYYMGLNYPVEIVRIPDEDGGGYCASIPMLGRYTFVGDGDTPQEALDDLGEMKRSLFERYLAEGLPIPEPVEEEKYSGRFLLRLPKFLHRRLAYEAKRNEVSLNQYVVSLLSASVERGELQATSSSEIKQTIVDLRRDVREAFAAWALALAWIQASSTTEMPVIREKAEETRTLKPAGLAEVTISHPAGGAIHETGYSR